MNNKDSLYLKFLGIAFLFLVTSCVGYKKTLYFQGTQETLSPPNITQTYKLKLHDILQIKILNPDTEGNASLSTADQSGIQTRAEDAYFKDYYINDSGFVELPFIGKLKLVGYTVMQVDSLVSVLAVEYYSHVSVDVKLGSFKFLALGEFKKPGQCFVSNESCTIYEAIGIAGDADEFANKQKMQLIRTLDDGSKKIYHIDLTDYSSFNSDNYFILPNDIIYLQPQKAKTDKQNITYLSIILSAASLVLLIASRL